MYTHQFGVAILLTILTLFSSCRNENDEGTGDPPANTTLHVQVFDNEPATHFTADPEYIFVTREDGVLLFCQKVAAAGTTVHHFYADSLELFNVFVATTKILGYPSAPDYLNIKAFYGLAINDQDEWTYTVQAENRSAEETEWVSVQLNYSGSSLEQLRFMSRLSSKSYPQPELLPSDLTDSVLVNKEQDDIYLLAKETGGEWKYANWEHLSGATGEYELDFEALSLSETQAITLPEEWNYSLLCVGLNDTYVEDLTKVGRWLLETNNYSGPTVVEVPLMEGHFPAFYSIIRTSNHQINQRYSLKTLGPTLPSIVPVEALDMELNVESDGAFSIQLAGSDEVYESYWEYLAIGNTLKVTLQTIGEEGASYYVPVLPDMIFEALAGTASREDLQLTEIRVHDFDIRAKQNRLFERLLQAGPIEALSEEERIVEGQFTRVQKF